MNIGITIALSVILGIGFLFALIRLISRTVQKKMEKFVQHRFQGETIVEKTTHANFFGKLSKGGKQIRGNGALVLTDEALFFIRALPLKEYTIPLNSIVKISLQRSFNGKSVLSKLLRIDYDTGFEHDSMAWAVKSPEKWKGTIENKTANPK